MSYPVAEFILGNFQIILGLQVHPCLRGHAEQATKAHSGIGGNGMFSATYR